METGDSPDFSQSHKQLKKIPSHSRGAWQQKRDTVPHLSVNPQNENLPSDENPFGKLGEMTRSPRNKRIFSS
jgi:hypothetical protein